MLLTARREENTMERKSLGQPAKEKEKEKKNDPNTSSLPLYMPLSYFMSSQSHLSTSNWTLLRYLCTISTLLLEVYTNKTLA